MDGRSEINKRLMQVILHAIERDGRTRRDIEHMAEASSPTVSDWFHKGAVPDATTIAKLARGLHVNAHWLLTGQGPKAPPGEGRDKADELFALGAAAVLQEHRELLEALETRWSASLVTHEDAIQRAAEAIAFVRREDHRAARTPGRRRQARKKKAG